MGRLDCRKATNFPLSPKRFMPWSLPVAKKSVMSASTPFAGSSLNLKPVLPLHCTQSGVVVASMAAKRATC